MQIVKKNREFESARIQGLTKPRNVGIGLGHLEQRGQFLYVQLLSAAASLRPRIAENSGEFCCAARRESLNQGAIRSRSQALPGLCKSREWRRAGIILFLFRDRGKCLSALRSQ